MSINFGFQTKFKLKHVRRIKKFLSLIITEEHFQLGQLSIVFTSDDYLLELNRHYLKHDYFTDIITFDFNNNDISNKVNGELYISLDRALDNAISYNVDPDIEIIRLMIHGVLHLCGYKDKTPTEKKLMTEKENYYLNIF
jgi:rRNA maturation RNase YbeY